STGQDWHNITLISALNPKPNFVKDLSQWEHNQNDVYVRGRVYGLAKYLPTTIDDNTPAFHLRVADNISEPSTAILGAFGLVAVFACKYLTDSRGRAVINFRPNGKYIYEGTKTIT